MSNANVRVIARFPGAGRALDASLDALRREHDDPAVSTERLYHLALAADWERDAEQDYTMSTFGVSLADQGFIHCSFASQVQTIADGVYRGRDDVVLIEIDPHRVVPPVRVESLDGGEVFPHIYGPLNRDAVLRVTALSALDEGRLNAHEAIG